MNRPTTGNMGYRQQCRISLKQAETHCHLTEKKRNAKIAIKKQLNHDICHKRKTESLVLVIEIKQTLQNRLFYYLNRKNQSSKQGQTIVPG